MTFYSGDGKENLNRVISIFFEDHMTRFSMVFLREEDKAEVFHAEKGKQGKIYERLK